MINQTYQEKSAFPKGVKWTKNTLLLFIWNFSLSVGVSPNKFILFTTIWIYSSNLNANKSAKKVPVLNSRQVAAAMKIWVLGLLQKKLSGVY